MSGEQRKFELSMPQIVGSALAAVTAAVAASYLGVAGTIIGAAVVSVASTIGSAIYTHYLKQTGEKVREHTVLAFREQAPDEEEHDGESTLVMPRAERPRRPIPWVKVGTGTTLVFAVSMGAILAYQGISGSRVDEQTRGTKDAIPARQHQKAPAKQDPVVQQPSHDDQRPATQQPVTPTPTPTPTPTRKPTVKPTPTPAETSKVDPTGNPTDPATGSPERPDTEETGPPVDANPEPDQAPNTESR